MAIAKRSFDLLLALGLVVVLSCKYDPNPPNGIQLCAAGSEKKQCPDGYYCHKKDGKCWTSPEPPKDAGRALDAPQAAGGSGGNGAGGSAGARDTKAPPINSDSITAGSGDATTLSTDDSGVACGGLDRLCCANNQCKAEATVCNGVRCVVCGSSGYPCCANNTCLGSNTVCSAGNCVPCGAAGQQCCSSNPCNSPLLCTGGICGQPNPDGGKATLTSTATATAYDAGIATFTAIVTFTDTVTISNTHTIGSTATRTPISTVVRTASYSETATATASETATTTGSKADAGSDASTSTSISTGKTLTRTGIITGIGIGTLPVVSPGLPSAH